MITDWQLNTPPATTQAEEPKRSPVLVELLDEIDRADEQPKPPPSPQPIRVPNPRPFAYD